MRIGFFKPFDAFYMNPTTRVYHEILQNHPSVITVDLLNAEQLAPQLTDLDIVVMTPFVFLGLQREQFDQTLRHIRRGYGVPQISQITFEACQRYLEVFLRAIEGARSSIAFALEYDLHALSTDERFLAKSQKATDFLLVQGLELFDFDLHRDSTSEVYTRDDVAPAGLSRGVDFLRSRAGRLISFPHALGLDEFCNLDELPRVGRGRRIGVPGVGYVARAAAVSRVLRRHPYEYAAHLVDRTLSRVTLRLPSSMLRQRLLWRHFQSAIAAADINFTCGSTSGYLVRKFFEIPAFGSCLATYPYAFLAHVGLKAEEHYLPIRAVDELEEFVQRLAEPAFQQSVRDCTRRGYDAVRRLHSSVARAQQLDATLSRIADGNFFGSFWKDGEYQFAGKAASEIKHER